MGPCAMVAGRTEPLVQGNVEERHLPYHLRMRAKDHEPKPVYCIRQTKEWGLHNLVSSRSIPPQSAEAMPEGNVYKMVLGMTTVT